MYLVKVSDLLQMKGSPKAHSFLQQENVLHQWKPGMVVLFISHQWLSWLHPDPSGRQLEVLQQALQGLIDGSIRLSIWVVLWSLFDFPSQHV